LIVVAVGLIACVAAALLSTDKPIGATELAWETRATIPDSKVARIPGGGTMQIVDAGFRATERNVSEYRLYRQAAILRIGAHAAVGQARVSCTVRVPHDAIVAHTPIGVAAYPLPSENLVKQEVTGHVVVEFNSHSTELARIELGDAFERFAGRPGTTLEWANYRPQRQRWNWGLPAGRPTEPLALGFASVWRTTSTPAARIACSVTTDAGTAAVTTAGSLKE
jgi:hypothetical protein